MKREGLQSQRGYRKPRDKAGSEHIISATESSIQRLQTNRGRPILPI